jgi:hypothetical protein
VLHKIVTDEYSTLLSLVRGRVGFRIIKMYKDRNVPAPSLATTEITLTAFCIACTNRTEQLDIRVVLDQGGEAGLGPFRAVWFARLNEFRAKVA